MCDRSLMAKLAERMSHTSTVPTDTRLASRYRNRYWNELARCHWYTKHIHKITWSKRILFNEQWVVQCAKRYFFCSLIEQQTTLKNGLLYAFWGRPSGQKFRLVCERKKNVNKFCTKERTGNQSDQYFRDWTLHLCNYWKPK